MDAQVETFYHELFDDLRIDSEEYEELTEYFDSLNPPPDKLAWLRSSAFRLGCEHLSEDNDKNQALLRTISAIVHCLEKNCMVPRNPEGNDDDFDPEEAESKIREIYSDLSIDLEESQELFDYFSSNIPSVSHLVPLRRTAFTAAVEYLSDDRDQNVKLLRCINCVINNFERSCFLPKSYEFKLAPDFDLDVSLSDAVQELWNLDVNRLTPNVDYKISVQGGKKPYWKEDKADDPLFSYVDREALRRPTYRTFIALLDNYTAETGEVERVTSSERRENRDFLDAIMETAPMQFCHKYLHKKEPSKVPGDIDGFKKVLNDIWFDLYRRERGGPSDSSGFEHVFVGEIKNEKISGFHNWIQFYREEQKGTLDYRGYIKPRNHSEAETDSDDALLTLQFEWKGVEKSVGTSFIGVSPEFEMALYTLCFLLGEEDNEVTLRTHGSDEFLLNIKCYTYARDKIGTAYPEALEHHD